MQKIGWNQLCKQLRRDPFVTRVQQIKVPTKTHTLGMFLKAQKVYEIKAQRKRGKMALGKMANVYRDQIHQAMIMS